MSRPRDRGRSGSAPAVRRPRILLADDHKLMAEALQHMLKADFDVVGTVPDGRALIKAAGELKPELVIVDISMPLLNGLDAVDHLPALDPDIKVIFLTQNREPRYAVEAFRRKASGYLLKDAAASELTTAIREVLQGRSYVSPRIAKDMLTHALNQEPGDPGLRELSARAEVQLLAEGKSRRRSLRSRLQPADGRIHKCRAKMVCSRCQGLRPSQSSSGMRSLLPDPLRRAPQQPDKCAKWC